MAVITYTESRPTEVLANLHASAEAEREYLFAYHEAGTNDLILVAWYAGRAVGYLAASDERDRETSPDLLVWEHAVAPEFRHQGIGRRLLLEAAKRTDPAARVCIDPMHQLDEQRLADYYLQLGFEMEGEGVVAVAADLVGGLEHRREDATTVGELLADKDTSVVTVSPTSSIADALHALNEHHIGAVVASTDGARVEGILSERDFLVGIDVDGAAFLDKSVADCLTTDVMTVTTSDVLADVMETMTDGRHRHLPVTDAGRLAGIVSVGDIVRFRLSELAHRA